MAIGGDIGCGDVVEALYDFGACEVLPHQARGGRLAMVQRRDVAVAGRIVIDGVDDDFAPERGDGQVPVCPHGDADHDDVCVPCRFEELRMTS